MSSPSPSPRDSSSSPLRKVLSALVVLLALIGAVLIIDRLFIEHPETQSFTSAPHVTVTAIPPAETPTASLETTTTEPQAAETAPAAEAAEPTTAPTVSEGSPAENTAGAATPAPTEAPAAEGVSIIESEGMEGDDYIVHLITPAGVGATQNHAAGVLASKVQELTGTPQAKNIDLVAVYSSDGVMVGSDRLPDGKWSS